MFLIIITNIVNNYGTLGILKVKENSVVRLLMFAQ